ncbi:MAG TPA: ClpXP protease specificity-enhancing factor SspB [Thermoanaerobaculia bacterium]|nr:ClpXP protease specificity-enhancing factor SspB [Thermoanaerobaculia bacterium]
MADDPLDYHAMVQRALRAVVREALAVAAEQGLPGDHHFFVSFRTGAPGVVLPGFLRDRFPEEVTIVLQHRFWELEVDDEAFSVTLDFDASRHRLGVPWEAVTAFVDPAAELALRFGEAEPAGRAVAGSEEATQEHSPGAQDATAEVVNISAFRKKDGG